MYFLCCLTGRWSYNWGGGGEGAYEQKLTVFHWMAIRTVYISIDPVRNNEALEEYTYNLFYKGRLHRWRLEIGGLKLGEHYSMYLSSGFNVAEDLVHSPCFWKHPTNSQTVPNRQEIASNLKTKNTLCWSIFKVFNPFLTSKVFIYT